MKILYVNPYFIGGGAELVLRQLYYGMKSEEIESFCIIGRWQNDIPPEVGVIYDDFMGRAVTTFVGTLLNNTLLKTKKTRKQIVEFVKKENIDIVHFHNLHSNYIGIEDIKEISRYCSKIVITLHDMWILTGGCAHSCECTKWKEEECRNCHGNYSMRYFGMASWMLKKKRNAFKGADITYVVPSEWLYRKLRQSYLKEEDIRVINNGIDLNVYQVYPKEAMRKKHCLPKAKNILLFVANGMNNIYKGFPYLLKALEMLKNKENYALLIVGNKPDEKLELLNYDVYMKGYITTQTEMNELYSAADLYIHPSMADVFPFTPMEAMASGTPVLAFETGGIPEIVNEDNGWLAEAGNAEQLRSYIEMIFADKLCLQRKTQRCRTYIEENKGINKMISEYRRLYSDIMN